MHSSRTDPAARGPRGEDVRDQPATVFPGFADVPADAHSVITQLAQLRRERGLSQTQVAARMGTSQSAVARLESLQADARLSTLERYASALDAQIGFAIRPQRDDPSEGAAP